MMADRLFLRDEHAVAEKIAAASGDALVDLRGEVAETGDSQALGARGDRMSHHLIMRLLHEAYPEDAVLSEEGKDDRARLERSRVWIIDPLDGTREFSETGRIDLTVHVALAVDGAPVAGAVVVPAVAQAYSTASPPCVAERRAGPIRLVVSRSRPPGFLADLAARLGAEVILMGSAGAKTIAVINGDADAYIHAGGQYEW